MSQIQSLQNPTVKSFIKLRESKHRKRDKLFLVEGVKELERALDLGHKIERLVICEELLSAQARSLLDSLGESAKHFQVSQGVYAKLAMREDHFGLIGVLEYRRELPLEKMPIRSLLMLEGLEKPGNLGALMRTATAAGIDAIFAIDSYSDYGHPQVIRNSLGACFEVPIYKISQQEAYIYCQQQGIQIYAAWVDENSKDFQKIEYQKPSAILLGAEDAGLSSFWKDKCQAVYIPMKGVVDSLNVSVSGALLMYQAR